MGFEKGIHFSLFILNAAQLRTEMESADSRQKNASVTYYKLLRSRLDVKVVFRSTQRRSVQPRIAGSGGGKTPEELVS